MVIEVSSNISVLFEEIVGDVVPSSIISVVDNN
jgi:hypothetical protein